MTIELGHRPDRSRRGSAFTLVEVIVCTAIVGIVTLAIYSGISAGVASIRMARENLRATQILLEKTESLRLYTWDQMNANGFLPKTFIVPYDATVTNTNGVGVLYYGKISINKFPPGQASYADDLLRVKIEVNWKTGNLPRSREINTYVAKSGIQNYMY
jgi:prepilin-type N-terminal cleavage/methylation domain-containing protein